MLGCSFPNPNSIYHHYPNSKPNSDPHPNTDPNSNTDPIPFFSISERGDRERAALGDSLVGIVVLDVELIKIYPQK
jgi:hypothetical protein